MKCIMNIFIEISMPAQFPAQLKHALDQVKELLSNKDNGEARRILVSVPGGEDYPQYHAAMARIALAEENKPLALAHLEKASSLAPENLNLLLRVGRIRYANEDIDGVKQVAKKTLELGAQSAKELVQLVSLLLKIEQKDEALVAINNAISLRPNDATMRMIAGRYFQQQGQTDNAEQSFKDSIRLAPSNHAAAIMLGNLYLVKDDAANALSAFKRADNADCPDKLSNRMRLGLAQAYINQSEILKAKDKRSDELLKAKDKLSEVSNTGAVRYNYLWGQIQMLENTYDLALQSLTVAKKKFDTLKTKDGENPPAFPQLPNDSKVAAETLFAELSKELKNPHFQDDENESESPTSDETYEF